MSKKKPVFLTFSQKYAAYEELKKHCVKKDGFAVYDLDWDDARVAAVCGNPVNDVHIRGLRREGIGNLRTGESVKANPALEQRITDIEEYLTRQNPNWRSE